MEKPTKTTTLERVRASIRRMDRFQCLKCNKAFQTAEERVTHIKTSSSHIFCQTCEDNVEFESYLGLYLHIKDRHPHLLYCDHRDHPCATVEESRIQTNAPPGFCCKKCDNVVETRSTLKICSQSKTSSMWYCYFSDHPYSEQIESSRIHYRCRVCNRTDVESDVNLRKHYQSHHPVEHCSLCHAVFGSVEEKILRVRTSLGHHCCEHCEEVLDFAWTLQLHYQSRHPIVYCSL